ncbi:unnamed protein product [Polarella glacialis]|uniref:Annexin n=1 Tax=Polarella glacialis TaxID=89957 RepID=A0A813HHX2_POLGL|nr:unnamed protein product [Polarella glacialis]
MGCSASAGVSEPKTVGQPEDPRKQLLLQRIAVERARLRVAERKQSNAQGRLRYNSTAATKLETVTEMMKDALEDEQELYESLKYHIAEQDALELSEASDGFGTDGVKLVRVIAGRLPEVICDILSQASMAQVEDIKSSYDVQFAKPMVEAIKDSMGGDWEKALLARWHDRPTYYATALQGAFQGWGADERAICRILGRSSKAEIKQIATRFQQLFGRNLRDAIEVEASGNFKKALLTMFVDEAPVRSWRQRSRIIRKRSWRERSMIRKRSTMMMEG